MNNKYFWIGQIEVIYKELGIRRTPILSNFEMFENIFDFQDTFYKQVTYLNHRSKLFVFNSFMWLNRAVRKTRFRWYIACICIY